MIIALVLRDPLSSLLSHRNASPVQEPLQEPRFIMVKDDGRTATIEGQEEAVASLTPDVNCRIIILRWTSTKKL